MLEAQTAVLHSKRDSYCIARTELMCLPPWSRLYGYGVHVHIQLRHEKTGLVYNCSMSKIAL